MMQLQQLVICGFERLRIAPRMYLKDIVVIDEGAVTGH
jgi:hypothetical protein